MKPFHEKDIEETFTGFYKESLKQFAALGIDAASGSGRLRLTLDDRVITDKKELNCTNGRYYFTRDDVWNSYIPWADSSGVYFFFNEKGLAVYLGKSERVGGLGKRIAAHIVPELKFPEAKYVIVVPFEKAPFLAVAFESYLLGEFEFQYNTQMNR